MEIVKYNNKPLTLKTSIRSPKLTGRTVIVSDRWEYVRFYLKNIKRGRKSDAERALFFWNQAEEFYKSSKDLSLTSSPLPLYYCFLNATKALIEFKDKNNQYYTAYHGVSGTNRNSNIKKLRLSEQEIKIKAKGVCPALLNFLDGNMGLIGSSQSLDDLLANLVYIHRTYVISQGIQQNKEMFIPLDEVYFVRKPDKYVTINAKVDEKYVKNDSIKNNSLLNVSTYQDSKNNTRISWRRCTCRLQNIRNVSTNQSLLNFHRRVRKSFQEISSGINSRWYFKDFNRPKSVDIPPSVIMFMSMHRLSEHSRYEPDILNAYLTKEHSWIISEFIKATPFQFINTIAAEITGEQLGVSRHIIEI